MEWSGVDEWDGARVVGSMRAEAEDGRGGGQRAESAEGSAESKDLIENCNDIPNQKMGNDKPTEIPKQKISFTK